MTYDRISRFAPINDVDNDKVKEIAESIKQWLCRLPDPCLWRIPSHRIPSQGCT